MRTYKQQAAAVKKVTPHAIGPNHEQTLRDATTSLLALEWMLGDKKKFKAELEAWITSKIDSKLDWETSLTQDVIEFLKLKGFNL